MEVKLAIRRILDFVGRGTTTFYTVWNSKSLSFIYLFLQKKYFKLDFLFLRFNKTDTSLYFLTVEQVAVSLLTKCLSNPTSGSPLTGYSPVFKCLIASFAYINRRFSGAIWPTSGHVALLSRQPFC